MFPAFPIGATIHSILVACTQTGRLTSVRLSIGGCSIKLPQSVMSYQDKPEVLAQYIFGGEFTSDELLLHHTVAPVYLSLIDQRLLDVTGSSLLGWCSHKPLNRLSDFELRLCPQCVEEDTAKFGCGHWRREHQLRSVHICARHLTALHEKCASANCGARFTRNSHMLPGQPCPSCHGTETSGSQIGSISSGYLAYCKLFTDALVMRIPELDPKHQLDLCDLPRVLCGGDTNAFSRLLGEWLGNQWANVLHEFEVAIEFLHFPFVTAHRKFIAPSLILLAAFKRDMFGAPPDDELFLWSDRSNTALALEKRTPF
jgi:TniQ